LLAAVCTVEPSAEYTSSWVLLARLMPCQYMALVSVPKRLK
jgi:hypothetical protein